MNCRIVGAICQHNFDPAQIILVSSQQKEGYYFVKNVKIVTLSNYCMHPCPCFQLVLNEIPLNKTKNASDVCPWCRENWGIGGSSFSSRLFLSAPSARITFARSVDRRTRICLPPDYPERDCWQSTLPSRSLCKSVTRIGIASYGNTNG